MQNLKKILATTDSSPDVETATRAVGEVQAALALADAEVTRLQAEYDCGAADRVAAGNAAAAHKIRKTVADARADADDLRAALKTAQARLQQARAAAEADTLAKAWAKAEEVIACGPDAMERVQKACDELIASITAAQDIAAEAMRTLPVSVRVPDIFHAHQLTHSVRMYLSAKSNGSLGKLGVQGLLQPAELQRLPDLIAQGKAAAVELLSHRTPATGEAA